MTNAVTTPQAEQKKPATHDRPKMKRSDRMLLKLILIGLLSVILLIPQQLILHMVSERNATSREAEEEVELQMETYALLFGSLGIFVILAVLMYASQKVKWYRE